MQSAVLAMEFCLFDRLSVTAGIVPKRLKLGSWDLQWRIAP